MNEAYDFVTMSPPGPNDIFAEWLRTPEDKRGEFSAAIIAEAREHCGLKLDALEVEDALNAGR